MKNSRRKFIKNAGMAGLGIAGSRLTEGFASTPGLFPSLTDTITGNNITAMKQDDKNISVIGLYGQWASSLTENKLPSHSFRRKEFSDLKTWKKSALTRFPGKTFRS